MKNYDVFVGGIDPKNPKYNPYKGIYSIRIWSVFFVFLWIFPFEVFTKVGFYNEYVSLISDYYNAVNVIINYKYESTIKSYFVCMLAIVSPVMLMVNIFLFFYLFFREGDSDYFKSRIRMYGEFSISRFIGGVIWWVVAISIFLFSLWYQEGGTWTPGNRKSLLYYDSRLAVAVYYTVIWFIVVMLTTLGVLIIKTDISRINYAN